MPIQKRLAELRGNRWRKGERRLAGKAFERQNGQEADIGVAVSTVPTCHRQNSAVLLRLALLVGRGEFLQEFSGLNLQSIS